MKIRRKWYDPIGIVSTHKEFGSHKRSGPIIQIIQIDYNNNSKITIINVSKKGREAPELSLIASKINFVDTSLKYIIYYYIVHTHFLYKKLGKRGRCICFLKLK